jgi:hypothetical protein
LAAPAAALAAEDGFYVDPDSPAGREYAVPMEQGRGIGSGHDVPPGERQPTFGAGVTPATTPAGGGNDSAPGTSGGDEGSAGKPTTAEPISPAGAERATVAANRSVKESLQGSASSVGIAVGTIVLILGGGGLLALMAGRLRTRST